MTLQHCRGCVARDHFLDMQESGGEWWLEGWRCINCGRVFDPVVEQDPAASCRGDGLGGARTSNHKPLSRRGGRYRTRSLDLAARP